MKNFRLVSAILFILAFSVNGVLYEPPSCSAQCTNSANFIPKLALGEGPAEYGYNRAYAWAIVALIQIQLNFEDISPPGAARIAAIVGTCLYESAALTEKSYGSTLRTTYKFDGYLSEEVKTAALDGAGYWALRRLFSDRASFGRVLSQYQNFAKTSLSPLIPEMESAVHEPTPVLALESALEISRRTAARAGAAACERVIEHYTSDGYAPRGDTGGKGDPTSYQPKNLPQTRGGITQCDVEMKDMNFWQPLCVPNGPYAHGSSDCTVKKFLYPWAGRYATFALQSGDEKTGYTLVGPPPKAGSAQYVAEMEEILSISAKLGDREKVVAEYWADGPSTTTPPGHLWKIAADAAIGEELSPAETARLLFIVGNAVYDAGIASWRTKVTYDFIRPLQMIQCGKYRGQFKRAWLGPYKGVGLTNISEWRPYQEANFVTPSFAGYTSGHSTFSAAATQALFLFFGSNDYRGPRCDRIRKGESLFEPRSGARPGLSDVPNTGPGTPGYSPAEDVVLCWNTFYEASDQSGQSRLYGGIHVKSDDVAGQALGKKVGQDVFFKASSLYLGTTSHG
eukprot:g2581.t1